MPGVLPISIAFETSKTASQLCTEVLAIKIPTETTPIGPNSSYIHSKRGPHTGRAGAEDSSFVEGD
jgi:hypothetical protein